MTAVAALPPLSDALRAAGIDARRSLGQNFLLDLNLTRKIARATGPLDGATVVEIGPGPGGLTRALFLEGARRVVAVERDDRFRPLLDDIRHAAGGALDIVQADALTVDWPALTMGEPVRLIANLPYNIATELLTTWLETEPWPSWFSHAALMFQREVADRIVAGPDDKAYGRLSVLAGWRAHAHKAFDVPPDAFVPKPKVVSTVVVLTPKDVGRDAPSPVAMRQVTAAAFGQRRKMLRSSLRPIFHDPAAVLADLAIAETARAEDLPVDAYIALARRYLSDRD